MSTGQFIHAINPDPTKQGVRIEKEKYDVIRKAILSNLRAYGPLTFTQLGSLLEDQLQRKFDGSVMWYYATVKLDMEARGEIHR
ncbi:MAG: hypothetical protein HYZ23_09560, partial [Chloroflexi bacterium]|nr:hypothetical protein [Chloroflexota bacterium]